MRRVFLVATALALLVPFGVRDTRGEDAKHKFMGVANCKMCHNKKENGDQFNHWKESKHSKAWEELASDKAKEFAKAKGIAGNPQEAPECLKCHVTGYGQAADLLDKKYDPKDGVMCESCHGPGGDYFKKEVMKEKDKAIAAGLVLPKEEVCKKCHNPESPGYKEFNFDEFYKKIAHPMPKK